MLRLQRRDERGVVCTQCGAGYGNAEAWVHPECQPFWFRSHPTLILKKTASHYGGDWADSDFVVLEDDKVNCTRKHLRANRGSGRSRHTSGAHHQPLIVVTVPRASKRWRISRRDGNIRALRWPVLTTTASGHTIDDHARSKNPGRLF
jgi:hypothetical protein